MVSARFKKRLSRDRNYVKRHENRYIFEKSLEEKAITGEQLELALDNPNPLLDKYSRRDVSGHHRTRMAWATER